VTTDEYFSTAAGPVAPRPRNSVLGLSKIEATGYVPRDHLDGLREYLQP
jgi:dTDP-4-dehydrorhamnose 3,5-epimerase